MQAKIFILGFVQGVGFRRFIRKKALLLGLTGWVKNLSDGRVETLVQGPRKSIDELIKTIEKGNWLSGVKDVVVDWEKENEKFETFEIVR